MKNQSAAHGRSAPFDPPSANDAYRQGRDGDRTKKTRRALDLLDGSVEIADEVKDLHQETRACLIDDDSEEAELLVRTNQVLLQESNIGLDVGCKEWDCVD